MILKNKKCIFYKNNAVTIQYDFHKKKSDYCDEKKKKYRDIHASTKFLSFVRVPNFSNTSLEMSKISDIKILSRTFQE